MKIAPNYRGGSVVNLVASIQRAFGSKPKVPTVKWLDREIKKSKNIVLLLIDGLGFEYLQAHGKDSFLKEKLAGKLTSVFPSTTAASVTSISTGVPPSQHGITSWFMWVKEFGMVIMPLPFKPRLGGESIWINRKDWFPRSTAFRGIKPEPYIVTMKEFVSSEYSRGTMGGHRTMGYSSLKGMMGNIEQIVKGERGRKFVYAYWPEFDSFGHHYGVESRKTKSHFNELDAKIRQLAKKLEGTNTTLLVTADHGMIDVPPGNNLNLENLPKLYECLTLPLSGEGRVAFCYVRPDKVGQFKQQIQKKLAGKFELHKSWELVRKGYFGPGPFHPRLYERVGDFILLAKENYALNDQLLGESRELFLGRHGGLSSKEMLVPICVIEC